MPRCPLPRRCWGRSRHQVAELAATDFMSTHPGCSFFVEAEVSLPLPRERAGTRATRLGGFPAARLMDRCRRGAIRGSRRGVRCRPPARPAPPDHRRQSGRAGGHRHLERVASVPGQRRRARNRRHDQSCGARAANGASVVGPGAATSLMGKGLTRSACRKSLCTVLWGSSRQHSCRHRTP